MCVCVSEREWAYIMWRNQAACSSVFPRWSSTPASVHSAFDYVLCSPSLHCRDYFNVSVCKSWIHLEFSRWLVLWSIIAWSCWIIQAQDAQNKSSTNRLLESFHSLINSLRYDPSKNNLFCFIHVLKGYMVLIKSHLLSFCKNEYIIYINIHTLPFGLEWWQICVLLGMINLAHLFLQADSVRLDGDIRVIFRSLYRSSKLEPATRRPVFLTLLSFLWMFGLLKCERSPPAEFVSSSEVFTQGRFKFLFCFLSFDPE